MVWAGISVPDLAIRIGWKIETAAKTLGVYAALNPGRAMVVALPAPSRRDIFRQLRALLHTAEGRQRRKGCARRKGRQAVIHRDPLETSNRPETDVRGGPGFAVSPLESNSAPRKEAPCDTGTRSFAG